MSELEWWQTAVIYQIYPRSFQDSTSDGIGDLPGITRRLDYLVDLGIDAIWISPFYPSPMADFGYDVADYTDVDPIFGTLTDFDELLATAHHLGLKVIIDIVPNHTSDQHRWFLESRSSRDNPKRDWYVWRDPMPDGSPPNNWLSAFGGGAWEWDETTGQFYLHTFVREQPDLNWRNPDVVEAMHDVYRFWLDRGVDGFRIDVAHRIMKDPDLRDNPPKPGADGTFKSMGAYETQHHIHDMGHPDVHDAYRDLRAVLDSYDPPRVTIGEVHIFDWDEWVRYYGADLDGMHLPGNFTLLYVPWDAGAVRTRVDELEGILPDGAWPNYVLGNHDEPRLATRFGPERARLAAMLLLTLRGTPTLYYGDELGMTEVTIAPEDQQDPWALREPELGRDGCRTPMQWDASGSAGFSDADRASLWLPLTPDQATVNVKVLDQSPTSILTLYRRLLALRRGMSALHQGTYSPIESAADGVFAFERAEGAQQVCVVLNFGDQAVRFVHECVVGAEPLLSTTLRRPNIDGAAVELAANEGLILRLST
ncbi:MAG: alpha-amylase family glycosyl hydrolase [Acidimicrobiia bacterium]|nr:alpha-amylase family glycosyl hydrolase [Acidimicrobiia bacterium]